MSTRFFLFDAEGRDRQLATDQPVPLPGKQQLLWLDFSQVPDAQTVQLLQELAEAQGGAGFLHKALQVKAASPGIVYQGNQLIFSVNAIEHAAHHYQPVPVKLVAWENVVISLHTQEVTFLKQFAETLKGDSRLGQLDAAAFLATLLSRHLESYRQALSVIETNIYHFDEKILKEGAKKQHLESLVQLRHRISALFRLLGAHRLMYFSFSSPDFRVFEGEQPRCC